MVEKSWAYAQVIRNGGNRILTCSVYPTTPPTEYTGENMTEKIWFSIRFEFNSGDTTKALRLHRLLKEYGVVSNITPMHDESINKPDRCAAILKCFSPGRIYSTGQLWSKYKINSRTGLKTFQRDLNSLVITGQIKGFITNNNGRTTMWSVII